MSGKSVVLVVLVVLSALIFGYTNGAATTGRPTYLNCTSTADCALDECCVLGMNRYSIPTCTKMRQQGEPCRPFNAPASTTVYYPGGKGENLVNVYYSLCGCADGLTCSRDSGKCE